MAIHLSFASLQAHSFFVFCLEDAGLKAEAEEGIVLNPTVQPVKSLQSREQQSCYFMG
jgi:hypothetical protein